MVTTERAKHFYSPQDIPVTLYSDADEWEVSAGGPRGEFLVLHPSQPPLTPGNHISDFFFHHRLVLSVLEFHADGII